MNAYFFFSAALTILAWMTGYKVGRHTERDRQQRKASPPERQGKPSLPAYIPWDYTPYRKEQKQ